MIFHQAFTLNPFQENTYIIWDENGTGIIVDPGCYTYEERQTLKTFIEEKNITLTHILNTHAHIDHVLGNAFVKRTFNSDYYLHELDLPTLHSVSNYAHLYGFEGYEVSPEPTFFLEDQQVLKFGEIELTVLFAPGHAPGHVVFYNEANKFVINGDVLFNGSFGRVDLPGGDIEVLKASIFNTLFKLPEDTIVYCGHGPTTTIGKEKKTNYIYNF
jgi:glyoxylase-like metal-dependent hydrolase (beta-lactamase superfamily II)